MRVSGAVLLGSMTAAGIAISTVTVTLKRDTATSPLGIKGDGLEVTVPAVPQADCAQAVWPYGCEWMNTSPATRRHLRPGQN